MLHNYRINLHDSHIDLMKQTKDIFNLQFANLLTNVSFRFWFRKRN